LSLAATHLHNTANYKRKHCLTYTSLRTFAPELATAFVPRVGLMGLSLAQPYLVNAAINYIDNAELPKSYGYGLIGAYGITYLGIAVCFVLFSSLFCSF
jgi:ATP-binding cassette, subfamily C (CFTR/MRP), member 1